VGFDRLCVFCGSSAGRHEAYRTAARATGLELARRGIGLVYGGGAVGLMGVVADAALEAGGEVIGVIPEALFDREIGHGGLDDLRVVPTMHARKAEMARLSDGFVALPGGIGTLEELFETWTWAQLGTHAKPCGILDVEGFFAPLVNFLDHVVEERFLRPEHRSMLLVDDDAGRLLDALLTYRAPAVPKWIDPDQT